MPSGCCPGSYPVCTRALCTIYQLKFYCVPSRDCCPRSVYPRSACTLGPPSLSSFLTRHYQPALLPGFPCACAPCPSICAIDIALVPALSPLSSHPSQRRIRLSGFDESAAYHYVSLFDLSVFAPGLALTEKGCIYRTIL